MIKVAILPSGEWCVLDQGYDQIAIVDLSPQELRQLSDRSLDSHHLIERKQVHT